MLDGVIKLAACVFAMFGATGVAGIVNHPEVPCRYKVQWHKTDGGYYQWFCEGKCEKLGSSSDCYEWSGTIGGVVYTWCDCAFGVSSTCDVWRISNSQWNCMNLGCLLTCKKPPDDGAKNLACDCK